MEAVNILKCWFLKCYGCLCKRNDKCVGPCPSTFFSMRKMSGAYFAKCIVLHFSEQACPTSSGQPLSRQWGLPRDASTSSSRAVAPGGLAASCPAATLELKGLVQTPPSVLQNVLTTEEDLGGAHQRSPPCDSCVEAFLQLPWHGQALSPCPRDRPGVYKHPNWLPVTPAGPFSWVPCNHGSAVVRATQCKMCRELWCGY